MKHFYTKQRLRRLSLMFILLIACASFVQAQDVWRGTTSTKWSVAANWSLGRVPLSTDDVVIGSSSIYNQPTVDASAVCKSLTVGGTYTSTLTVNYPITVSGNVIINSNGTVNHAASQTMTVKGNWTCSGNYYGQSTSTVTFAASGTQTMNGTNVDFKNLTVNAGSTILLNTNVNADVSVVINGTWDPNEGTATYLLSGSAAFSAGATAVVKVKAVDVTSNYMPYGGAALAVGSTVDYASTLVTQNIYSNFSYDNIKISGSGIKKLTGDYAGWNTSGVDVGNITVMSGCTLDLYSFSLSRGNTGGTLTVNDGATLRIGGTNSLPTFMNYAFGTNSTVEYYGSPQTITPASYGNLWITGTGTKTAGGALTVNDLSLSTATFVGGSYTHSIKSDWSMTSGVFTNTGTTIQFNGTGAQTISSTGAFNNLVINKTGGSTTLLSSITVNGTLTFTNGNITTGANKVIIPSTGTISRTSGHVVGNLQKYVSTGSNISRTFEVGDASNYTPVTTLFASVSVGGSLVASTTSGSHASIASSTVDPALDVNRYWTLTNSGITFTTYSPTFTFVSGDVSSGATTGNFIVGRYSAGWTYPTVGTKTATTTQATGLNAFGDFLLGEVKQSFGISYAGSPFCNNASTGTVTLTGTSGGTYTSTAGLTINAATGTITPSASTPGTYTVTYTRGSSTATTSVTITAAPSATISYSGPFCKSVATAQAVTFSGTTGGTFSASPAGLTINPSTGAITPSTSTAGTYTVTYSVAAAGGCATFTTTTSVTINAAPSATISYAGAPFCNSVSSTQAVTLTGTTGGTYSSTAGLTINATTGDITPSSSTPGTYTVTYTVAASGGCSAYSTTATVTVVAIPTATISYAGPFCSSNGAAQHVTRVGTTGGTFTASPAGLTINTTNGDITPSTSTPGTYTVTYAFASGGCSATTTTSVTINAAPSATISYAGPFCSSSSTAQAVTLTGTTGGTFSSTAGLTINSSTGAVTPSTSTVGTYTVTYTVAASGACAAYNTTTSVSIVAAPSAAISYASSSFCKSVGAAQHVTRTGTTGGTFTASPAGLTLNAGNGDITPSTSTAGTYTVTYTVAAANGCAAYTTTTSVMITAAPSATVSYASSSYCNSVSSAQAVTVTGTTGGTFSSTAGLTINVTTGAITPSSSTPGTYTVTYTVAGSGGCTAYSTTTSVTITAAPSATIAYTGSPYATNGGTISVVRTGTSGGTYSSTAGLSINATNGDINLGASTIGTYTVTYTIAASGGCAAYTTTATITINSPFAQWTGTKSTDWKTAGNWNPAKVPDENADVIIPAGLSVYPIIPGSVNDAKAEDLTIASGASLTLYGTLTVGGNISSSGGIIADSIGTVVMKSTTAQTISANAFANELFDLTIDNNAGVTLLGKLKLNDALTIKNGALTSNGNLILRSTAVRTARVAPITSKAATPIIGDVTVERYVAGRRKYRLITSAVTTSTSTVLTAGQESRSIWGNWQNSGNNSTPGIGTFITGGTAATGFDTQTGSASLYTYNDITRKFVAFSTANGKNTKYTPLVAGVGYYMFVYGDRTNSVSTPTPNNTTMSETGTLVTGDQLYTTTTPIKLADTIGKYTLIGNPFASPINWQSVKKSGVDNVCWGWDPNLGSTGGYVTVNATLSGTILISPLSVKVKLDQYIQSGQAFFVRTTGKNPTITIQENDKVTNVNNLAFRTTNTQKAANAVPLLAVNLLYTSAGSEVFADGAVAAFDNSFADTLGTEDALKIAGSAEAVSIENSGQQLSIDARPKALNADTLNLNLAKLTKTQYTLQVFAQNMIGSSVQGYLVDRYLKTSKVLSLTDTNNVVFNIVPSDSASFDPHRFYVSLVNLATLPVNYTAVLAMQEGKNVQVQWNVAAENNIDKYQVEKSTNGVSFTVVGEVASNKLGGDDRYSWLDTAPVKGYNYYRVRAVGSAGASYLSKVVNLKISSGVADITVSPNPVKDQQINLQVSNIEIGTYNTVLYDPQGREVYRSKLNYTGGFLYQALQPRMQLTPGMYYLRIFNERTKYDVRILME